MTSKYYWCDETQSVITPLEKMYYLYCVDTHYIFEHAKYGMYTSASNESWLPIPKDKFPKAFLANLLLLGVV